MIIQILFKHQTVHSYFLECSQFGNFVVDILKDWNYNYYVNVISFKQIKEFGKKYADSRNPLFAWYHETVHANWEKPQDIKERYSSASFLENDIVIFNIKGNRYRLVTKIAYNRKTVFIKWIGTHAEYDKKVF